MLETSVQETTAKASPHVEAEYAGLHDFAPAAAEAVGGQIVQAAPS